MPEVLLSEVLRDRFDIAFDDHAECDCEGNK